MRDGRYFQRGASDFRRVLHRWVPLKNTTKERSLGTPPSNVRQAKKASTTNESAQICFRSYLRKSLGVVVRYNETEIDPREIEAIMAPSTKKS